MSTYLDVEVGEPLTPLEEKALAVWDESNGSSEAVADALGYTGSGRLGNATNPVRRALRKTGRGDEIGQRSNRATGTTTRRVSATPKVKDREAELTADLENLQTQRAEMTARLDVIIAESEMDDEAVIEHELSRLEKVVADAQARLDRFIEMEDEQKTAFTAEFRNRARERADREQEGLESGISELNESIEESEALLEVVIARKERQAQADAAEMGVELPESDDDESATDDDNDETEDGSSEQDNQ